MIKHSAKARQMASFWLNKYLTGESIHYKQVIAIFIPILVDQSFLVLMSMLNTAMISSAGVTAISAVNMVDALNIFIIQVFIAVATGGTVIVAQYKGKGDRKSVSKAASQAILTVTFLSLFVSIAVILFHESLLAFLFGNAEQAVFQNATLYLIGSALSYPFIAIYQAVNGALRGVGDTKPTLILSFLMNATNTALNFIFIVILNMGIIGLVLSILIARLIGSITSLIYLIKINETINFKLKNALRIDFTILKKVLFIGIPFAAEQLFFHGGKLLTQTFIVKLGTLALTVNAIGSAIGLVYQMGPISLSIAIVTIVGQCMGKRNIRDARKFTKSFIWLSSIMFIIGALIILPSFPLLMKMFSAPVEIQTEIFIIVAMSTVFQPILWSFSFLIPAALRAAGDSTFTSVVSMLSMWLFRVVLGYILGITLGLGMIGVWAAMIFEWGIRGSIFLWRFRGEKWYQRKLV